MTPPINSEIAIFTDKLNANSRVNLYDKNYLGRMKWLLPLVLITVSVSLVALFYFGGLNLLQVIISSCVAFILLVVTQFMIVRTRVASLKGDALILKDIASKSTITSIRSLRKVRSYRILGVQVTRLNYTLDKRKRSSLIVGAPLGMTTSLDQLLTHAKKNSKKIKGKS